MRATDGKVKIATSVRRSRPAPPRRRRARCARGPALTPCSTAGVKVTAAQHERFAASYTTLQKVHMNTLKKRVKKDKKDAPAAAAAKKK